MAAAVAASSSNPSPQSTVDHVRDWLELPHDVMSMILSKLDTVDILNNAQKVCTLWRTLCLDPVVWRRINIRRHSQETREFRFCLQALCRNAVDRSSGQLFGIYFEHFGTDELLKYITDSTSQLHSLRLVCCFDITDVGMVEAVPKLPMLEELELSYHSISKDSLEAIGRSCPLLKSLKLNSVFSGHLASDVEAIAIGESMPNLRYLQMFGNHLTGDGLQAILNGCPHLESLDLRQCFHISLYGDLRKRVEQINHFRLPKDPTDDYEFDDLFDCDDWSDCSGYGYSDLDLMSDGYLYGPSGDSDYELDYNYYGAGYFDME